MTSRDPDALRTGGPWAQRLPGLLTPVQVGLDTCPEGFVVRIDPMDANAALALVARFGDAVGLQTGPDDLVTVTCPRREDALVFIAERLRRYVADVRRVSPRLVRRPDSGLVDRLLDRSGFMRLRPIETEVHSTAIDIGIGTNADALDAADTSIIYDLCSGTWHTD